MRQYRVIKRIKNGLQSGAKVGTILTVERDFNRLGGPEVLMNGKRQVCDLGSRTQLDHCVLYNRRYQSIAARERV